MTENLDELSIKRQLEEHRLWLKNDKKKGRKADFSNKTISDYNFSKHSLKEANFDGATIKLCRFNEAELSNSSFEKAEVLDCDFNGAKLHKANFSHSLVTTCDFNGAKLHKANFSHSLVTACGFTDSKHLTLESFKKTDLSGSALPKDFSFDNVIAHTDHLIKKSLKIFIACFTFNIFTLLFFLFIHGHNKEKLPFPFVLFEIINPYSPSGLILIFITMIIFAAFFSLSQSSVMEELNKCPAVFPDGRCAHETVFPWFWITWSLQMWHDNKKTDNKKEETIEKNIFWKRIITFSGISNISLTAFFIVTLFILKKLLCLISIDDKCLLISLAIASLLSLIISYKTQGKNYTIFMAGGAIITWAIIYFLTDLSFMLNVAIAMIVSWLLYNLMYTSKNPSVDISIPEYMRYKIEIDKHHKSVQLCFDITNVFFGMLFCGLAAWYIFNHCNF